MALYQRSSNYLWTLLRYLADVVDCGVEPVNPMHLEGPFLSGKLTIIAEFLRLSDVPAEMEVWGVARNSKGNYIELGRITEMGYENGV